MSQKLLQDDQLSRKSVNAYIAIIKQMFKWAQNRELVLTEVYLAIQDFEGIRKGRGGRETSRRIAVPWNRVEAVRGIVSPQVWAMIELQWYTGMRPGSVCIMRSCDIDTTGWLRGRLRSPGWREVATQIQTRHPNSIFIHGININISIW